jgi:S-sulfo-L-cysteine synthase (3-phospho-L-serine-dependent)
MGNILLVGSGGGATKGLVFKTILKNGDFITLIDKGNSPFNRLADYIIYSDPFTTENWETVYEQVSRIDKVRKITAVLPMSDLSVELAAIINEKLGLKGLNTKIASFTRNKARLRELMRDHNLNVPKFIEIDKKSINTAKIFSKQVGYPVVIKPVNSAGSLGVYCCTDERSLEKNFINIFNETKTQHVIVEEFLDGPEISVEAISQNGEIVFSCLTEKVKIDEENFVEKSHIIPCDIPNDQAEIIMKEVDKLLKLIGLTNGISHTEVKLTSKGPYIIEMASRAAGAYLPDLIELAYGINPFDLWIKSITSTTKIQTISKKLKRYASVSFFYPKIGQIKLIPYPNELDSSYLDGLIDFGSYCRNGDYFNKPVTSNFDRIGHIVVTASNKEELKKRIDKLSKKLSPLYHEEKTQIQIG